MTKEEPEIRPAFSKQQANDAPGPGGRAQDGQFNARDVRKLCKDDIPPSDFLGCCTVKIAKLLEWIDSAEASAEYDKVRVKQRLLRFQARVGWRRRPEQMRVEHPDPKVIAARERRRKSKAARKQKAFEERTARQFEEFEDTFERIMDRAQLKAAKLEQSDRGRFRQRSREQLVERCFRSRMTTAIYRRRMDWHSSDVAKWLKMLGVDGIDVSEILEAVGKRYRKEGLKRWDIIT